MWTLCHRVAIINNYDIGSIIFLYRHLFWSICGHCAIKGGYNQQLWYREHYLFFTDTCSDLHVDIVPLRVAIINNYDIGSITFLYRHLFWSTCGHCAIKGGYNQQLWYREHYLPLTTPVLIYMWTLCHRVGIIGIRSLRPTTRTAHYLNGQFSGHNGPLQLVTTAHSSIKRWYKASYH